MRQLAYYNAVPDKEKRPRREIIGEDNLVYPDIDEDAKYIIQMLFEAGLCKYDSMGTIPLGFNDISSYSKLCGIITRFEAITIRNLSNSYVAELHKAKDKNAVVPYIKPDRIDRAKVANGIALALRSLKKDK